MQGAVACASPREGPCLSQFEKNSLTQKRPSLANFSGGMAQFGACTCCKMFLCDLCASATLFICMQHPPKKAGVINSLSEAGKITFLTQKRPFLAVLFHERWHVLRQTHAVNCFFLIFVNLHPALSHRGSSKWGGGFKCLSEAKNNSIFDAKAVIFCDFA